MSIDEMIQWIDEYLKTLNDENAEYRLTMIGIFLAKLKDLLR